MHMALVTLFSNRLVVARERDLVGAAQRGEIADVVAPVATVVHARSERAGPARRHSEAVTTLAEPLPVGVSHLHLEVRRLVQQALVEVLAVGLGHGGTGNAMAGRLRRRRHSSGALVGRREAKTARIVSALSPHKASLLLYFVAF